MSRARQDRVAALLMRDGGWVTAAALADTIGVTPRSIRSYVTALNARVTGGGAVESGPHGYRAGPDAHAALRVSEPATPRDRLHRVVRAMLAAGDGIDVFETAEQFHVSPATLEADLGRIRALLGGTELVLERVASRARLTGTEMAQRRLLSRLAHDETEDAAFDLEALRRALGEESVGAAAFGPFKTELVAGLGELGYFVNEFGLGDVMVHIAITADRVARGHALEATGAGDAAAEPLVAIGALLDRLSTRHLGVQLGEGDRRHLAALVQTRVIAPGVAHPASLIGERVSPEVAEAVRDVVTRAAAEFLVDIDHDDFVLRLALHVQNLRERARAQAWSRNPLTRSLKTTYPMIFEVAVFIADGLRGLLGIALLDDEIAYIAMHVGGRLERSRRAGELLTATIVCPGYYELHELLRSSVDRSLGQAINVVEVETRVDPDWSAFGTDLVLTTIDAPGVDDRVVRIQPFLTETDVERVQTAAARVRRARRLARLRAELERYFSPDAFVSQVTGSEEAVIRELGALLVAQGVIDDDYVERTLERERLSSTAFTDALAVPHALGMTAARTAIAVGIADPSMAWGEGRVQVVAMVAFSESDRAAFQTVFEQLVEVFSERDSVQRIVRRATTFAAFLDELVAVVDG